MRISDWSSDVCSSDLFLRNPPPTLNATGSGPTQISPHSYDLLESVNVHLYCPVGGVFSLGFTRYKPEGDKLFDCEGIYAVTNNDGRWAIEMVSTMIHERGFEGDPHPDAETEARLASEGYLAAFGYRNETLLDDRTKGRGSFEERRSEEHTSELPSLMRISYAVSCLTKKKQDKNIT